MSINLGIFYLLHEDGRGWFRLFGKGLSWKNYKKYGLTFSQRNKLTKTIKIGRYAITFLK